MRIGRRSVLLLVLVVPILMAGCGGGGSVTDSTGVGSLKLTVVFPARETRALPVATNSVRIKVSYLSSQLPVWESLVARGTQGEPVTVSVDGLAATTYVVQVFAYSTETGDGMVIAQAQVTAQVIGGQTTQVSLVTEALGVQVEVTPSQVSLAAPTGGMSIEIRQAGETAQLIATSLDADGNVVLGDIGWESDQPEVATVSDTGLVTAVSVGQCVVTATERLAGVSGVCSIVIGGQ